MISYPSIQREYMKDIPIYAFDKLDGSNIRVEWSAKKGFYKFGTKGHLIDKSFPIFGESVDLFTGKYGKDLVNVFEKQRWRNAVCFCEFYGKNSFAGSHKHDEPHDIILFDISVDDAILKPREFIDCFEHLHIPKLLYRGIADDDFIKIVHNSKLEGITFEGVVCKGTWNKKRNMPWMFKIKTNAWIDKLKSYCNGNMDLMARLL
jgi:hypothetical protein